MTNATCTHLIYDGKGGWIEAKKVWIEHPEPGVDGVEDGEGWEFKSMDDCIRWLRA